MAHASRQPFRLGWLAALGAAAGAALMYVLDPDTGRRRRVLMRDTVRHAARRTGSAVEGRSRDVVNRARGVVVEMRRRIGGERSVEAHSGAEPGAPSAR